MLTPEFRETVQEQFMLCDNMLCGKAKEYATDEDRLHNFKVAAALKGETPRQALAGMMAKHTVSVYDMCMSDEDYPMELWDEKLTDSIDYHILLRAIIKEEKKQKVLKEATRTHCNHQWVVVPLDSDDTKTVFECKICKERMTEYRDCYPGFVPGQMGETAKGVSGEYIPAILYAGEDEKASESAEAFTEALCGEGTKGAAIAN